MDELHIFFLPFLAPGHMIPMVDLAKLFAARGNVRATIVTTVANAPLVEPSIRISPHPIHLLTLPFPSSVATNVAHLPTPDLTPAFIDAIDTLTEPFNRLLVEHRPDCIVSDIFYPWSADLACEHDIPRVAFHGTSAFTVAIMEILGAHKPQGSPFLVPSIPHRIEMEQSQLPNSTTRPDNIVVARIVESYKRTFGTIMNTSAELEAGYAERLRDRVWFVGPVSLCNRNVEDSATRGGEELRNYNDCMNWLDAKSAGSVIYVCFGSLGHFTSAQLREISAGLLDSGRPFVWVVRHANGGGEWIADGLEGKGLIVRGWAPQIAILNHPAVGGFMTHCGWNSCLEGLTAGLPMVTWPLFAEQFFNERLLVDVLRVGVSVGAKVCSGEEEKRTLVKGEVVAKAVNEVMGDGEEADGRRKRAMEAAAAARAAMEEGGSSHAGLSKAIQELVDLKKGKDLRLKKSNVTP